MNQETILIVEDEIGLRELIQLYLMKKGYRVLVASDGEQALKVIEKEKPHLIILDIEMPGMNGFEVCKQIRAKMTLPILFLSSRRDVSDKIKCFELGGDDYITKPFDFGELEARMKANLRRYQQVDRDNPMSDILTYGELEIHPSRNQFFRSGESVVLSVKEGQLLILFAKSPNHVWSAEQLYDRIWGIDSTGNIETVKVHISNLRRKLERDPSDPQYIQTVRGFGYLFVG